MSQKPPSSILTLNWVGAEVTNFWALGGLEDGTCSCCQLTGPRGPVWPASPGQPSEGTCLQPPTGPRMFLLIFTVATRVTSRWQRATGIFSGFPWGEMPRNKMTAHLTSSKIITIRVIPGLMNLKSFTSVLGKNADHHSSLVASRSSASPGPFRPMFNCGGPPVTNQLGWAPKGQACSSGWGQGSSPDGLNHLHVAVAQ